MSKVINTNSDRLERSRANKGPRGTDPKKDDGQQQRKARARTYDTVIKKSTWTHNFAVHATCIAWHVCLEAQNGQIKRTKKTTETINA